MRNDARSEKKVSSRELRRAYRQTTSDLQAFTGAAAQDLTNLQSDLRVTRELCADLSERLEKLARELVAARLETTKLAGALILFISQGFGQRLVWFCGLEPFVEVCKTVGRDVRAVVAKVRPGRS